MTAVMSCSDMSELMFWRAGQFNPVRSPYVLREQVQSDPHIVAVRSADRRLPRAAVSFLSGWSSESRLKVRSLVFITCGSLPSSTDSDTSADQRQHARKPAPHHHLVCRTRDRYRLTDGGLLPGRLDLRLANPNRRSRSGDHRTVTVGIPKGLSY